MIVTTERPRIGGLSWSESIAMMRGVLHQVQWSDECCHDFSEREQQKLDLIVHNFNAGYRRLAFTKVRAARLIKIWRDFAKLGFVRDEGGMESIADTVMDNIAMLYVTNRLSGHDQVDPRDVLEAAGHDPDMVDGERFNDFLTDPDTGGWYVSDYGLPYLMGAYALIHKAKTAEEKLYAVDKALNVVHQRSDLAAWFVEGGSATLSKIFD